MARFDAFKMALGKSIRAFRDLEGLTQANLAERADVTDETISRIERGAFEPTVSTCAAIAAALGVSVDNLLGSASAKRPRNAASPLVQQLAARAEDLDTSCQRALLRLAELLPTAPPAKKRRKHSER